jgi:AcrR family transcriptional regulator
MSSKERAARLSRDAWITGAIKALVEEGLEAIAVEPLARQLGVTKGSFYWHFENREELLHAVIERWEELGVDAMLREIGPHGDPRAVLSRMVKRAFDIDRPERRNVLRLEVAMAAAAESLPVVRAAFGRVTTRRLEWVIALYRAAGLDERAARDRGFCVYTSLLGIYPVLLARRTTKREREEMARALLTAALP